MLITCDVIYRQRDIQDGINGKASQKIPNGLSANCLRTTVGLETDTHQSVSHSVIRNDTLALSSCRIANRHENLIFTWKLE